MEKAIESCLSDYIFRVSNATKNLYVFLRRWWFIEWPVMNGLLLSLVTKRLKKFTLVFTEMRIQTCYMIIINIIVCFYEEEKMIEIDEYIPLMDRYIKEYISVEDPYDIDNQVLNSSFYIMTIDSYSWEGSKRIKRTRICFWKFCIFFITIKEWE